MCKNLLTGVEKPRQRGLLQERACWCLFPVVGAWPWWTCVAPSLESTAWLILHCHPAVSFVPRSRAWSMGPRHGRGALGRTAAGAGDAVLGAASATVPTPPNALSTVCPSLGTAPRRPLGSSLRNSLPLTPSPQRGVTQPLLHRMVWVGRDLKDHLVPTPPP